MKKFKTIVADPPWDYKGGCWDRKVSKADSHYGVMTVEDIANLPIQNYIADDAYLFLWITSRHIIQGIGQTVAEAWGFRPLTTIAWCKPQIGLGYYIRNSHEHVILGVRGSPGPFKKRNVGSWFVSDRKKHSRKPEHFTNIVESLCDGPYLELFARRPRPGWTVWGDELNSDPFGIGFDPKGWK